MLLHHGITRSDRLLYMLTVGFVSAGWFIDHTGFVMPIPGTAIGTGVVGGAANVDAPYGGPANAGGLYGRANADFRTAIL
jgi:hypothetical protein